MTWTDILFRRRYVPTGVSVERPLGVPEDAFEAGVGVSITNRTVPEDTAAESTIGALSIRNEPDDWGTTTWSITADADNKFDIDGANLILAAGASFDFETDTFHDVTVAGTSSNEAYDPATRTIRVIITNVIEAPVNTVAPVASGVAEVGEVVECSTGTWTDMQAGTFAYQWKDAADDSDIELEGADTAFLPVAGGLVGISVYCRVTATNSADSAAEDSNVLGPFEYPTGEGAPDSFLLLSGGGVTGFHLGWI